jgi:microcystin-dependent protein
MPLIVQSPPESRSIIIGDDGKPAAGARLFFFDANTTTPQVTYTDVTLATPHTHPVVADSKGRVPRIFLLEGRYRVRVEQANGVLLYDDDDLQGSFQTAETGDTPDFDPNGIFQTGDLKFRYDTSQIPGWVRSNGNSIGSPTSGATERANADMEDLFVYLWQKDSNLAVPGGRGGSAAADWAANKTIATPDLRGRTPVGLDTMGAAASGRLTDATMSPNATTLGATGGSQLHVLTKAQLPTDPPTGTVSTSVTLNNASNLLRFTAFSLTGTGSQVPLGSTISPSASASSTFTGAPLGSGQGHSSMQPSILGTFYIKA